MSTYDPNRNRVGETRSDNTGWIIGAIVVLAIIVGVFVWAPWGSGGGNQTAATTPATTSAPATRETTGAGGAPARAPASAPAPAAPAPAGNH